MDVHVDRVELKRAGWIARERALIWAALAAAVVMIATALSAGESEVSLAPYFQVTGAATGIDALPLKSTQVTATVAGVIADVRVVQTYQNDGATPLEARYIFPGSTRAAVHGMTLTVGTRRIEALIKEKGEARKTYEVAKTEGRTAALLEAERSNLFAMNVANIVPGDVVTVELRYSELLVPTDNEYEWVFPTVVGPRYINTRTAQDNQAGDVAYTPAHAETEPVFTLALEIAGGVPVQSVTCTTHRIDTSVTAGRTHIQLPVSETPQMNRDFILRYRLTSETMASGLLIDEWRGEKFFLFTLQPPARVTKDQLPPRDYVFVVDVSGSMGGFPLTTANALMRELLLNLCETDTFNVLLFSGASQSLAEAPLAATAENITAAIALVKGQKGGGGTELLPALKHALALPKPTGVARSIVVVTDGYVTVEAEAHALVRENLGAANLFAFGIGDSVNRELIERLARAGRAEPAVIEDASKAPAIAEKFRTLIESPVLTQVRTEFTGFAATDVFPQVWPDVLAQRPLVVVGKFSGAANGRMIVRGYSGAGPWEGAIDVAQAVNLNGNGVLAQLWARERLEQLRDLHALGDQPAERKTEMVKLGIHYNLLTPYTSFVAVDTTPRLTPGTVAQKVNQPASLPAGVSEAAVADDVPTTPEPETVSLLIVAAIVVGWGVWRGRKKTGAEITTES